MTTPNVPMSGGAGGMVGAIPVLGALALGSQRLLPLLQQAFVGWSATMGNRRALADIAALLNARVLADPAEAGRRLPFAETIALSAVSFGYEPGRPVLQGIDLVVRRGERIGIVGPTGGGKSTLLDLLMGLIEPDSGAIAVDGRVLDDATRPLWQAQIAHVPQSVYLTDDTLASNIAFGIRTAQIDMVRVRACAEAAHIARFIGELPEGFETKVGERGIRLSGGQRQRIGIARALYKAAIASVMALGTDITLVMIAHRRSTLEGCDRIVRIDNGQLSEEPRPARGGG